MNADDLKTLKTALGVLDRLVVTDYDKLFNAGASPCTAATELQRVIDAAEKTAKPPPTRETTSCPRKNRP